MDYFSQITMASSLLILLLDKLKDYLYMYSTKPTILILCIFRPKLKNIFQFQEQHNADVNWLPGSMVIPGS